MRYKNNNERCVGEKDKKQVKDGKIREVEAKKKQIKNGKKKGVEVKEKEQVKDGTKKGVKVKEKKQVEDGKKKGVEVKNKKQVGRKRMRQVEKDSNVGGVNKKRLIGKREKRWTGALDKLYYTLVEQRWEEAFALLPCVLLQPPPQIPNSLLWKVIDVVSLNAHSVPIDLREQLRRHVCELQVSAEEVVLDSLPKLAPTFDNSRVTELRQFLDDVAVHNLMLPWDGKKRVKELCEASIAKIEQHRWMSSYSEDEQDIEDGNFGNSSNTKEMKEARSLYTLLKKSYKGLEEPAEWLLLSLLMQECEVYGKDKATATLDNHLYAYPHRPPALRLALYCHRTFLPTSVQQQTQLLKTLVTVCPSDPRVLDYIDHLLKERKGSATEDKHTEARNAFDSNSDSGMDEGNKAAPIGSCFLKSEERVSTLLECLEMLVNLLYYQEFVWELKPWAKLTELLSYFYTSWLRCWSCGLCKGSRKRVRKMTILVCLVWQYLVWLPPSPQLSHDKAEVLLHHVFAAHIFCHNNERYMKLCRRVVKSVGLEKALDNLLFPPCSDSYLHEKFILYVQKKHSRSKSRVSYNGQNDELETKTQAIPQARKGRMIKELLSQIPKTSRTNFNQHKSACSSISNSQQTDQTGVIREIERVADLTFNETDFLTSTQLRSQINVRQKRQARDCDASFLEYVSIGPKAGCSVSQSQDGDYNKERGKTKKTKKEKKKVVERKGQTLDSNINGSDKSSENDTVQISLKHKPARETYSSLDSRSCSYRKQCQNELFSYQTHLTQEVPDDVNVLQRDYLGKNYKSQDILRTACNPLNKYGDYPDVEAMNINSEDDVMTCGQRLLEEQQLPTVENTLQRWTDGNNSEADTDTHWAAFPSIPTDTAKETPLCSESEIESEAARSLLNRIIESRGFIVPINENRTGVTMENRSQAIPEAAPRDHHCKRTWKEKEYVVSERYQSKVVSSENVNTVNMSDQGEIIKQEIQTASILDIDPLGTFQGTLTVDKDATMSYRLKDGGEPFVMDRKLVYKKELQHDPAYEIYDDMDVLDELQLKKHDISDIEMDCDNTEYTGTYHATQPTISLNTKRAQIVSCDEESHQSCSVALFSYNETGKSSVASKESGLISLGCGGDVSACTGETYSVSYINATQYPQPVNTTQSSPQPVNTTQSSRQPVNTPQSSLQPVNTPQSSLQPVNTPQSSLQPVNTTQSSPQPVNTTQSSPQPVNTRQSSLQPVNTTQSSPQPVNTIQSSPQPVNTAQSSLQPVNTTQPSPQPVNTTQSSPQPVNTPQSSPQPVITPQSSPQPVNTHLPHSNIKNLTAKMLELSKNEEQEEEVGQKKSLLCSSGLSGQQRKKTPTSPLSGNVEGVENSNESNDNLRSEVSVDSQRENAVMSIRKRPKITDNMIEKHNYLGNDQFVDGPRETVLDMRDEGENHSKGKKSIKMLSCKNSSESEVQVIASNAGRMVKKKNKKKKKMITHTNSSESEVQVIASNAVYKVNKKKKKKMLTHTNFSESEVQVIASNTVYKVNKKKKKKKKMLTHINSRESEVQVIGNNSVCKVSKKKKEKKKQKELDDGVCDSVSHVKTTRKETHDSELECVYQEMRKKTKSKHKKRDKSELKLKKLRTVNGFGDEASCGIGTERKESELSFRRVSKSMSRCDNDDEASCGNGTKDNRSLTNRKTPQPLLHPKTTNLPLHNRENVDEMHRLEEEKESALSKSGKERNKISPSRTENGSSLPSPIQNDVDIIDNLPESYNLLQKRKKGEKHKSTIRKKPCNSFVLSHSSLSEPQAMPHNVVLLNRPRKKKKQKNNLGASSNVGLSENKVKLHSHKNGRIFQENPMEIQKSESNHRDKMKSPGTPSGKELRRAVEYGGAAFPGVSSEKSNLCSVTGNNQTQPSIEDITTCPPQYKRKKLLHKPPTHMFATGDEESVVLRIENEIEDLHKQKECVDSKRKKSLEREAGKKCKKSSAIAKFSSFSDIRGSQLHCNILVKVCKKKKEKKCRKFCDDNSSDSQIQRRKKVRDSEVECVYQDGKRTKKSRHNESHLDTSSSSNKKLKKALEYGGDNVPVYTERSNNSLETDQKMSGSCKKKSTPAVPSLSISSMSELEVISCSAVCSFKNVKKKNVEKGDVDRQFNHQIEVHDHEVECVYPEVKRNKKRLKSPISVENVHKRRKKRKVE